MNLHAIYHRPKSNYCYAYDKNTVHIRIRSAKGELTKVSLIYGDKYNWENTKTELDMNYICCDNLFDYYMLSINPHNNRLSYYFIVEKDFERYYYTEWGFFKSVEQKDLYLHFFNYPYINEVDIHSVPEWVKDAIFYQIFPERFFNGDKSNDPENITKWGSLPESHSFYGGDLKGIINKLDYLEELGINALYLTPIFHASTNHKYDTTDYMKIDPHFGDLDTVKELVSKCHKKGIRIILDAVFNHCGYYFEPFQDVLQKGEESIYYNWFHIKNTPIKTNPPNYHSFGFTPQMPKLNTENPEVMKYLLNVAAYWLKEVDIDGWRLDVANEVDHSFWREFRKVVKSIKKDAYIIGEIWHDSLPWLMGDQFDSIMNYPVTRACFEYFAYEKIDSKEFKEFINSTIIRNTTQVNEVMFNLLDSHDTSRFITRCGGDFRKLILAMIFQLTYIGVPCIYYGTEIGIKGGDDPDCRRTMEWDEKKWNKDLLKLYRSMIYLRKNHESLRRGSFKWINGISDIIGYIRKTEEEEIIILINNNDEDRKVNLNTGVKKIANLLDKNEIYSSDNNSSNIELTVNQRDFKIFITKY